MALTVADRAVRLLTADDVLRMVEAGILAEDERVELLGGVLTRVSPQSPAHAELVRELGRWLHAQRSAAALEIRTGMPLIVPDATYLPEPDVAVLARRAHRRAHPHSALLVVEVAVSSQRTDLEDKPAHYAAAGVPEYWVLDVPARSLVRFTDPSDHGYRRRETLVPPALLRPLALDAAPLDLAGLFSEL